MSCLNAGLSVYGSNDFAKVKESSMVCSSILSVQSKSLDLLDQKLIPNLIRPPKLDPLTAQSRELRWWERSIHPNMIEIESAQELVDSLLNAGERLVVVGFYSPECGGCRALHPKICQIAEVKRNVLFLQVNYENHKEMCCALNVHVLPFFRFYRGNLGKACSFSCTSATIKKFKDAMARYGSSEGCVGSAKGMDESELSALAARGLISRNDYEVLSQLEDWLRDC